ncbi:50S ribosomal protein L32 [Blattabacterium cuenoti]|uniref:50S ribosomal protein L32 n=1 Tax=Blattabacterium cuenoti TaxID=1653831 RepID=UPI00163C8504|nr:50S ribosomal protein L32 [Blattabacterium cuenoti]
MAHPKRKQSKSRRNNRRMHIKLKLPLLKKCISTNQMHLYHHAYWFNGKLYHKGRVVYVKEVNKK